MNHDPQLLALQGFFISEGIHDVGYDKVIAAWDKGCVELGLHCCQAAEMILDELAPYCTLEQGFPGVFEYEVTSPLGVWLAMNIMDNPEEATRDEIQVKVKELVTAFFAQGKEQRSMGYYKYPFWVGSDNGLGGPLRLSRFKNKAPWQRAKAALVRLSRDRWLPPWEVYRVALELGWRAGGNGPATARAVFNDFDLEFGRDVEGVGLYQGAPLLNSFHKRYAATVTTLNELGAKVRAGLVLKESEIELILLQVMCGDKYALRNYRSKKFR